MFIHNTIIYISMDKVNIKLKVSLYLQIPKILAILNIWYNFKYNTNLGNFVKIFWINFEYLKIENFHWN